MRKQIMLFLPLIILTLFTINLALLRASMPEVTVRIEGYDPRDLLSGHYLAYTIDWPNTNCAQFPENKCPETDFWKAQYSRSWGQAHRFYIPQRDAHKLEQALQNPDNVVEIVYSYRPQFQPIAKRLLINGKEWQEVIN